jgi:hypothetical protein
MLAHVKWYVDDPHDAPIDLRVLTEPLTLGLIAGAVVLAVVWRLAAHRLPTPELPFLRPLARLAPWVPRLLGVHLGVSLLALSVSNAYLAPHLSLADVPGGTALGILQGVVGVWLITGIALRPAALAVVALGPLGMVFTGPLPVIESIDALGVAIFLALLPPGPDRFGARPVEPLAVQRAVLVMRVAVGAALIVLAFSEKLLVPDLAEELLAAFPEIDVFRILGIAVPAEAYVRIAAITELAFGLLLISGAAPQVVVLVAAVPFNLTLLVFDRFELIGHLPVYGVLAALLVYGSDASLAPRLRAFAWHDRPADREGVVGRLP